MAGHFSYRWRGGAWMGGFQKPDQSPTDGWYWITDEPWEFTAWGEGEPNDYWGPENGLAMFGIYFPEQEGAWLDAAGAQKDWWSDGYLVEYPIPQAAGE
mgnify:CR=1 FL=1